MPAGESGNSVAGGQQRAPSKVCSNQAHVVMNTSPAVTYEDTDTVAGHRMAVRRR